MDAQAKQVISFAEFELDTAHRRLLRGGSPLALYAKAFDLLVFLIERNGQLVTKDEILENVWAGQFVEEANLSVQISALRKALGESKNAPRFLITVPGKGYKFVADVGSNNAEIIIKKHKISRLVVEETEERVDERKFLSSNFHLSQRLGVGLFLFLLLSAFGIYQYFIWKKAEKIPFDKIKFTRLTNSGNIGKSVISPDGKYFAYVANENLGNSIWVQQVGTASSLQIVPPTQAEVYELTFTPDGSHIYYSLFAPDNADLKFYRIPSLGGITEQILNVRGSYLTFSPDGKRIAYIQSDSAAKQNHLVIADADGGNQRRISTKNYPNTFVKDYPIISWSPDGQTIACLFQHSEDEFSVIGINPQDGGEKSLSADIWFNVWGLEWVKDGSGLLISAAKKESNNFQVYFIAYPNGEKRQITNDLTQYNSLSTTSDGKSFISVQTTSTNSILVGSEGTEANEFTEIISETGGLFPIEWTPEGKIIFRSNKDGISNLWVMDANGENRRQLTTNAEVNGRNFCLTPDGKYIVFESRRSGNINLWRVDSDGRNLTSLTDGEDDVFPSCAPDNRTVIYQMGFATTPTLWKVNLNGGQPVQLTDQFAKWNAISNDNRRVSYLFMDKDKWRIGIIPMEGGKLMQQIEVPDNLRGSLIRWLPDNRSLAYISTVGNVENIGILPLDGSKPRLMTNFKSGFLRWFSWSPDRQKLAVVRGVSVSDVVFITNESLP